MWHTANSWRVRLSYNPFEVLLSVLFLYFMYYVCGYFLVTKFGWASAYQDLALIAVFFLTGFCGVTHLAWNAREDRERGTTERMFMMSENPRRLLLGGYVVSSLFPWVLAISFAVILWPDIQGREGSGLIWALVYAFSLGTLFSIFFLHGCVKSYSPNKHINSYAYASLFGVSSYTLFIFIVSGLYIFPGKDVSSAAQFFMGLEAATISWWGLDVALLWLGLATIFMLTLIGFSCCFLSFSSIYGFRPSPVAVVLNYALIVVAIVGFFDLQIGLLAGLCVCAMACVSSCLVFWHDMNHYFRFYLALERRDWRNSWRHMPTSLIAFAYVFGLYVVFCVYSVFAGAEPVFWACAHLAVLIPLRDILFAGWVMQRGGGEDAVKPPVIVYGILMYIVPLILFYISHYLVWSSPDDFYSWLVSVVSPGLVLVILMPQVLVAGIGWWLCWRRRPQIVSV